MMYGFGGHGWGMGWGWILMLVILGLIVWFLIRIVNPAGGSSQASRPSPLDILKERYAKGEISNEEFEEKRKQLS